MSLLQPHPLWTTSQNNSYEVNKSITAARILSGRYRSDWHCRYWSPTNKEGFYLLCPGDNIPGNIEHMLSSCPALQDKSNLMLKFWSKQTQESPQMRKLVDTMLSSPPSKCIQFVCKPSVINEVMLGTKGVK